jgi:hypothetical protein
MAWTEFKDGRSGKSIFYRHLTDENKTVILNIYETKVINKIIEMLRKNGMYNNMRFGYGKDDELLLAMKKNLNLII